MIVFPNAKINLGLRVTGERPDGYHNIETIFYPVSLCDALEFVVPSEPLEKDLLTVTGIYTGTDPADNLVMKAVRKLREKYTIPFFRIHLHKAIPVGAGLGGGSSDSAYIIKALNKHCGLAIENHDLKSMVSELGSDCPFFIDNTPSFAQGRGELLNPVTPVLKGYYFVLLNPRISVNTKEAYQHCHSGQPSTSLSELVNKPVAEWKDIIKNDFEDYVFSKYPITGRIKEDLYRSGALFCLMSGSGSSVYGIFSKKPQLSDELKEMTIFEGIL